MRITQEEIFGPVMTIIRVKDEDEAIRMANDCPFGLGSSVFTKDQIRGERMAKRLRSGMTVINDYGLAYMIQSLPFGGIGNSGFGRINGPEGLRACCYEKAIVSDRIPIRKSVAVHPIDESSYPLIENTVRFLYGRGVRKKAQAAVQVARGLAKSYRNRQRDKSN